MQPCGQCVHFKVYINHENVFWALKPIWAFVQAKGPSGSERRWNFYPSDRSGVRCSGLVICSRQDNCLWLFVLCVNFVSPGMMRRGCFMLISGYSSSFTLMCWTLYEKLKMSRKHIGPCLGPSLEGSLAFALLQVQRQTSSRKSTGTKQSYAWVALYTSSLVFYWFRVLHTECTFSSFWTWTASQNANLLLWWLSCVQHMSRWRRQSSVSCYKIHRKTSVKLFFLLHFDDAYSSGLLETMFCFVCVWGGDFIPIANMQWLCLLWFVIWFSSVDFFLDDLIQRMNQGRHLDLQKTKASTCRLKFNPPDCCIVSHFGLSPFRAR